MLNLSKCLTYPEVSVRMMLCDVGRYSMMFLFGFDKSPVFSDGNFYLYGKKESSSKNLKDLNFHLLVKYGRIDPGARLGN